MSRDEKRICQYCKWWRQNFESGELPAENYAGECRVDSPVVILAPRRAAEAAWPETFGHDWCGKFEFRDDRAARLLGTRYGKEPEAADICQHKGWRGFEKDGRACPDCGSIVLDFGD